MLRVQEGGRRRLAEVAHKGRHGDVIVALLDVVGQRLLILPAEWEGFSVLNTSKATVQ